MGSLSCCVRGNSEALQARKHLGSQESLSEEGKSECFCPFNRKENWGWRRGEKVGRAFALGCSRDTKQALFLLTHLDKGGQNWPLRASVFLLLDLPTATCKPSFARLAQLPLALSTGIKFTSEKEKKSWDQSLTSFSRLRQESNTYPGSLLPGTDPNPRRCCPQWVGSRGTTGGRGGAWASAAPSDARQESESCTAKPWQAADTGGLFVWCKYLFRVGSRRAPAEPLTQWRCFGGVQPCGYHGLVTHGISEPHIVFFLCLF